MKACETCAEVFPDDAFYLRKDGRLSFRCKACCDANKPLSGKTEAEERMELISAYVEFRRRCTICHGIVYSAKEASFGKLGFAHKRCALRVGNVKRFKKAAWGKHVNSAYKHAG